ncbi:hypothetical protein ZIOFF_073035 [Zingiber officinale]|uniref:Trehalose 6-phosphate phosphatase n=1 Tax=Zingiber officinale TaxID=94328 RepID=A0A8J5ESH4_ZINOF|nr:hypothetical protein ZIOFF_073035 [Zingiber officinale]
MTNRKVVMPDPVPSVAVAVVADPLVLLPYPPQRSGSPSALRKKRLVPVEHSGGSAGGWLESMKASSPTHAKSAAALAAAPALEYEQLEHAAWTVSDLSHSFSTSIERLDLSWADGAVRGTEAAPLRTERVREDHAGLKREADRDVLGLRRHPLSHRRRSRLRFHDGRSNLPEPPSPCSSHLLPRLKFRFFVQMRAAVKEVAKFFPTAIVSGRCRSKVPHKIPPLSMQRLRPPLFLITSSIPCSTGVRFCEINRKRAVLFQPASEFLPMINEVHKKLQERIKPVVGAKVENNKFCVSVHFRCVREESWKGLVDDVLSMLKQFPKLRMTQGRKVLEIRPTIKWDKGKAVEFLLESLGSSDCKNVVPVYIGDDRTDEDAFKVLRERGDGFGILVSKYPKKTNASYSLTDPSEVGGFGHGILAKAGGVETKQLHEELDVK